MSETEIEYAEVNRVEVLETNILHASDVIYWLDGSTAEEIVHMRRLDFLLDLNISALPRDARLINRPGMTAILRKPELDIVPGIASEVDKLRPDFAVYAVSGEARDHSRRFNPVRFDLELGTGTGEALVLYPSPLGTRASPGGMLFGRLLLDGGLLPLPWAMLELEVSLTEELSQLYRAQCDAHGDFAIALNRLPPLSEGIVSYAAVLRVSANTENSSDSAPDFSTYSGVELQAADSDEFNNEFVLAITPGQRTRVNSSSKNYLAAAAA
jgi:hypothetical protein